MAINLTKGGRINLEKEVPGLARISVGLGWDSRDTDGADFDLDASVFLLGSDGKVRGEQDIVFFNRLEAAGGAVRHLGDNLTGEGEGDDEGVEIDLNALAATDAAIQKLAFVVTIHEAEPRNQNFGQVENAFFRIVDQTDGKEIVRFDLTEDYSTETAIIFGEIYSKDGQWRFSAAGSGFAGGLSAACAKYGL